MVLLFSGLLLSGVCQIGRSCEAKLDGVGDVPGVGVEVLLGDFDLGEPALATSGAVRSGVGMAGGRG